MKRDTFTCLAKHGRTFSASWQDNLILWLVFQPSRGMCYKRTSYVFFVYCFLPVLNSCFSNYVYWKLTLCSTFIHLKRERKCVDWIYLLQDTHQWQVCVCMTGGEFLERAITGLSKILLRGGSWIVPRY